MGPVHWKVAPGSELEVSTMFCVTQTVLPAADIVGVGCTITVPEVEAVQLLAAVTVNWYCPLTGGLAALRMGFCELLVKFWGPVQ